ncbi:hypothetical protein VTN02DRAFT_3255 [Thermoascus thermophilus]
MKETTGFGASELGRDTEDESFWYAARRAMRLVGEAAGSVYRRRDGGPISSGRIVTVPQNKQSYWFLEPSPVPGAANQTAVCAGRRYTPLRRYRHRTGTLGKAADQVPSPATRYGS